jgi:hypothetical protein
VRETFFNNQSEPETMADLGQEITNDHRFARASHAEQNAMLRSVADPRSDSDQVPTCRVRIPSRFD